MPTSNASSQDQLIAQLLGSLQGNEVYEDDEIERLVKYGNLPRGSTNATQTGKRGAKLRGPSGSYPQSMAPFNVLSTMRPNNRFLEVLLQLASTRTREAIARGT